MLDYTYTHAQTEGTTGYFACIPQACGDLDSMLALLEASPLDTFLHRHALKAMGELDLADATSLAQSCLKRKSPVLACLLLEWTKLAPLSRQLPPSLLEPLRRLAAPFHRHGPLAILTAPEQGPILAELAANFAWHKPLRMDQAAGAEICGPEQLAAARNRIERERGMLAREHARLAKTSTPQADFDPKETGARALALLSAANILAGPEMRHEASLSPIALLRQWHIDYSVRNGRNAHHVRGLAFAYGRGLSLARARAGCLMEIVERASAYATVADGQVQGRQRPMEIIRASCRELENSGQDFYMPPLPRHIRIGDLPLHWLRGEGAGGRTALVPAQAVFLFCNLDEPTLFESLGSTGLATGNTPAEARLSALTEILERDANATTPFRLEGCFRLASRNEKIQSLLDDYSFRHIHIQFQDITTEAGLPAYRCFVRSGEGDIAQATGASLCGARAALAALTETPWPYSWAGFGGRASAPAHPHLPLRMLEDLPDYSLPSSADSLLLLENVLRGQGREPIYVDIGRGDLEFPVVRAFAPGMAASADFDGLNWPDARLLVRALEASTN